MSSKSMTLRLSQEKAAELEAVSRADGMPVSEAVRVAIEHHIAARRKDKAFRDRLKQRIKEDQEILERLAK